jgi:hypothetical protein
MDWWSGLIDHLYTRLGTTLYNSLIHKEQCPQPITVSTSRFLSTDLTQWRFFAFRGHAIARWLRLHTWTQSAIFSASLAEPNSRLTAHLKLRNWTADSQLISCLQPFCAALTENTVYNNTPIVVSVFTFPLLRNGLHNPVVLLLRACMLRTLPSNSRCLQSKYLSTGLYATVCSSLLCDQIFC